MNPRGPQQPERPAEQRTQSQNQATSLVEGMLRNPGQVAEGLIVELRARASPTVVGALLDTAAMAANLRGVDLSAAVRDIRSRLFELGYSV